ncbi:uncharacterized protein STEHIDRAFT_125313 [Stereum hirsutum FP-91666 SS1]|uniref:uncharacterized protein n=1 Tax=Stereum hirsutum (strain FP-91666) TaxID=721885 RepID=UPI0004449473|nr:uncharacterized protein STEHIDRAFT_125313 [Stereum hirsutum FP-91666 SS1]EIM81016.1 hypothetical protein STEHIDRAFT_125313 [Stereum hirsutum FP-91666 SS1]
MAPPPPPSFSSSSRILPKRTDSLLVNQKNAQLFGTIEDEVRDCRRVGTHGQEEDLRQALDRMIGRVEELCNLLKQSYQTSADLETSLTLAQSNLQLSIANNEMLEDALRRNSSSKDVGWRRSARDQSQPSASGRNTPMQPSGRPSLDEAEARNGSLESPPLSSTTAPESGNPTTPTVLTPTTAPPPSGDSRFFRFRFNSTRSIPTQPSSPDLTNSSNPGTRPPSSSNPPPPSGTGAGAVGHLTSASLPSLLPDPAQEKELEELRKKLEEERKKYERICGEKKNLEGELESLSQALFEEISSLRATREATSSSSASSLSSLSSGPLSPIAE